MSISSFSSSGENLNTNSIERSKRILRCIAVGLETLAWLLIVGVAVFFRFMHIHIGITVLNWKMLCVDMSLYATHPQEDNSLLLYTFTLVVPLFFLLIGELEHSLFTNNSCFDNMNCCKRITQNLPRMLRIFAMFILGVMLASFTADYLKILIQKPRPYFLTSYGAQCPYSYNGTITGDFYDSLKSFPSHLACVASFSSIFAVGYANLMHSSCSTPILMTIVSKAFVVLGVIVSLNEYSAHRNHLEDVIGGMLIGLVLALYMITLIRLLLRHGKTEERRQWPNFLDFMLPRVTLPPTNSVRAKKRMPSII